jgi:hypothetical protein
MLACNSAIARVFHRQQRTIRNCNAAILIFFGRPQPQFRNWKGHGGTFSKYVGSQQQVTIEIEKYLFLGSLST